MISLFFHMHVLFAGMIFVGGILFVIWAKNNLKAEHLEHLSFYLLGIGIIGMLITSTFGLPDMIHKREWIKDKNMKEMNAYDNGKENMPMGMMAKMRHEEMMKKMNNDETMPTAKFEKEEIITAPTNANTQNTNTVMKK